MQSLQARLLAGGFPHVNFRIINSKETANNTHHVELLRHHAGHIPVFQQTSDTNHVWQTIIEGGIDHVLVLDSCGRLSYQVISPWSLVEYPYVKAAVLSTYRDDPCGPCNITDIQETESLETENSTDGTTQDMQETPQPTETMENTSTQVEAEKSFTPLEPILENNSSHEITEAGTNQHRSLGSPRNGIPTQIGKSVRTMPTEKNKHNDKVEEDTRIPEAMQVTLSPLVERSDGTVPLKVIIRDHHTHLHEDGTISEYEYLVLQTGNPEYHGHLESEENVHLLPPDETTVEVDVDVIPVSGNHSNTTKKHSESGQTEIDESSEEKKLKKIKHKGKKYPKKVFEKASEEIKDIKNEEEKILKNKGKSIQIKQNQGNSQEVKGSEEDDIVKPKTTKNKVKKIKTKQKASQQHNELDEIDRTSIHKERQEETELQDPLFTNESQENSREKDQATLENSKENTFTDEETSSSEVSQDIRKHNKPKPNQSFENNTLHFNRVIHKQKPTWHNKHKVVMAIKEINNTDHEHLKKMKINKKIITQISRNDTISKDITLEDRGNQLVKNIEVHKKKHYTKKGKLPSVENYMSSTHVPIPIAWHNHYNPIIDGNINLIDESKPSDQYKSAALIKTADSTEVDDENLQWIDEEPVATNTENLKDKTLERIQSEESEENSVRGEDVIMHYSKLLKWIEFPL